MKYKIGKRIKFFREKARLQQDELAELIEQQDNDCKLTAAAISNWERGVARPNVDVLANICSALNVSSDELLDIKLPSEKAYVEEKEKVLIEDYRSLNEPGKEEASKRVEELTHLEKYTKPIAKYTKLIEKEEATKKPMLKAAHAIEGASEEDKQHDHDIMMDDSEWDD